MAYVVAPAALGEIQRIIAFIGRDNRIAARNFRRELEAKFVTLAARPEAFRLREEFGRQIRVAHHGSYLILFRAVSVKTVRIVRIIHGSRDLMKLLKDDPA
ncbi:type II toxin-antitoxin system RelE/ParE family toxin [Terrarubrum flagellatum]|uniref:type II toxin-antitoxin system RelE/ParE family toxin n=1 Tax=Terrirubrum flagellatum TaxID=2895980 RepID=UPI0031450481